jgi:hypothetical protein
MEEISAAPRTWPFLSVLAGGLVAGTLDITYACVFWALRGGTPPQRIFQSVAKGVLGPPTFKGGAATAALGLFLHYFIAITMSVVFYLVAGRGAARIGRPQFFWAPPRPEV